MNQLNSIIVEGNVVRKPEILKTTSGFKICKIPIAVNRFYKNQNGEGVNEVSYFDIETYKTLADACEKNCDKGRGMRVVGRLKQNRWKSADGKMNSKISIIAEHIEFKPRFSKKDDSAENLNAIAEANKDSPDEEVKMEYDAACNYEEAASEVSF